MDPVLSSLLKTNQIGADGFDWWIGQVESTNTDDPKKSGRYKVRIVGHHLKSGQATPTSELPWAQVMMPVTVPFSDGGVTGGTANLRQGNWVLGFFLDNDKQKPIILGSIGHTAGATEVQNTDPNPGGKEKSFTSYTSSDTKPQVHRSVDSPDGKDPKTKANTDGGEPAAARSHEKNGAPAIIAALRGKYSEANPIGSKTCVTVANPKCGNESNFSKQLTNIVADLLASNQASGGQLGDFYVSKVNGFLYDKVSIARYHIGRVTRLVRSLLGRIQSEIIKKIREGIEEIIKAVLGTNLPEEQKEKTPVAPEKDFDRVKGKGNLLKRVKKILDKILQALGCAIEDATDRLVQWLTDLLFGFIMDVFSPAVCSIINLVDGIVNQILAIIEGLISSILGPIQSILSILGNGLNVIGSVINKVMSFLGITCSGPSGKCSEQTKVCNDCGTDEDDEDFLDRLLKDLEEGDTGARFNCEESLDYPEQTPTKITFVGGVPESDTPDIPANGSVPEGSIDPEVIIPDSFFPSTAQDPSEDPSVIPSFTDDNGDDIFDDGTPDLTPFLPPEDGADDPLDDVNLPEDEPDLPLDPGGDPYYSVVADPTTVTEGDIITYTIRTSNVPIGTVLNYTLSGDTIVPEYIVGESLTGSFTILEDSIVIDETVDEEGEITEVEIPIGIAIVQVQLAEEGVLLQYRQEMLFTIDDTDASANVVIIDDAYPLLNPDYDPNSFGFPDYQVTTDKEFYYEGEDIIYTITTSNVPDGTKLLYEIYGDISANDFIQDNLSGTITIRDNTARVVVGIIEDMEEEFDESVYFSLIGTNAGAAVTIIGTAVPIPDQGVDETFLNRPVAGAPITDENGSIISIPVKDRGDKYLESPFVIITGEGFGATGIALLDNQGYVSEIRVTRGGLGYKVNRAEDTGLRCVIDSFTLVSPGIRYTSVPSVYINDKLGIAEAEIDSRGYVVSVKVLDRRIVFSSMPKVTIIGGGGIGAIAIPSLVCLEGDDLERRGYVKIGTGRYIDCP